MLSRFQSIGLGALVFGAWLLATPYFGIRHDAILYTAQALSRLQPDIYANDLFFRFGSQDSFTIFPGLHALVIRAVGVDQAAWVVSAAGKVVWFPALMYCCACWLRGAAYWLGLALVAAYSPFFDSDHAFSYGESFATARIFAEALVLAAIGLFLRQHWRAGVAALALALAFHPLVAIPGILFSALSHRWKSPKVLIAICAALVGAAFVLALFRVEPFTRLLQEFDPEWLQLVRKRNPYVFLDSWRVDAFGRIAFLSVVLIVATARLDELGRHLARSALWLLGGSLLVSWCGAVYFHDVLITQLQLWRALWLGQIVALLMLGGLTPQLWRDSPVSRALLVLLWTAALSDGVGAGVLAVGGYSGALLLARYQSNWQPTTLVVSIAVLLVGCVLFFKLNHLRFDALFWMTMFDRPMWMTMMSDVLVVLPVVGFLVWAAFRQPKVGTGIVLGMGSAVLAAGLWWWDCRANTAALWSNPAQEMTANAVRARLPTTATIFWPNGLERTWFWLRRAHYASREQTAGILFSRATAMEAARRQARLLTLGLDEGNPYWNRNLAPRDGGSSSLTQEGVRFLCQDAALDFVVIPSGADIAFISVMEFRDPFGYGATSLVDCGALRKEKVGKL